MLKSIQIAGYPKEYYDLFHTFKDGGTIREFINKVETLARNFNFPDDDALYKFKGDMLEVLSEIFFNIFYADENVGVAEYEPIFVDEDYGVDAMGVNPNGHKVAIQVKYRRDPKVPILYTDIAKTFTAGIVIHELDLLHDNTIYIFTTSNGVTPACQTVLGDKIVVITREIIARKIDNNHIFWKYAYGKIYEYLDNMK